MAKGAWAKEQVWNKILETFPSAFVNEKEIRVPLIENGERVEIKITLTCAKTNVGGEENVASAAASAGEYADTPATAEPAAPTAEEKANVASFLMKLGL